MATLKSNPHFLMIIGGLSGVYCLKHVVESTKMHIWNLDDYDNHVWVRETITFPVLDQIRRPFPLAPINMCEIVFTARRLFRNMTSVIEVLISRIHSVSSISML